MDEVLSIYWWLSFWVVFVCRCCHLSIAVVPNGYQVSKDCGSDCDAFAATYFDPRRTFYVFVASVNSGGTFQGSTCNFFIVCCLRYFKRPTLTLIC